jgi:hypothetical protein
MSGQDAPSDEMPKFARQARLSREHEDLALDMLLDGMPLPPETPPEMSALPPMLADLSGPAGPSELAGEAVALSRFRRHHSPAGVSSRRRPERRMPSWQSPARRAQLAAALAMAAIGLGGSTAAYTGSLPPSVQELAAHVIGAPTPSPASHHAVKNAGRAPHPRPPAGTGAAQHVIPPPGHPHPTPPALGQLPNPWRWLRNPHHHGHGFPPGQLGKVIPRVHPSHPVPPTHPAHPAHPQPPRTATAPWDGSGFRSHGHGGPARTGPPGQAASHGHGAHSPPSRGRPHGR